MTETTYFVHGPTGIHQQQNPDGSWEYIIQDGLGSVRVVVDADGNILRSSHYSPFGEPFGVTGAAETPFGFTGEMIDPNNLVYLRARYYDPALGVFPTPDPLEGTINTPMSLNRYSYAQGNPINRTDPSGMMSIGDTLTKAIQTGDPMSTFRAINEINTGCGNPQMQYDPCWCHTDPLSRYVCQVEGSALCPPPPTPTPVPGLRLPINDGRLSNCEFPDRTGSTGIRSRDVNPPGVAQSHDVYSTVQGQVMIVDTNLDNNSNQGLGNFVAIRVDVSNLPANLNRWGTGYLYIGYAHLSQVFVAPGQMITPDTLIGRSGSTGLAPGGLPHLDVTVYYVPSQGPTGLNPQPNTVGLLSETRDRAVQHFQNFYAIFQMRAQFGITQEVDPLDIWPDLRKGTGCP